MGDFLKDALLELNNLDEDLEDDFDDPDYIEPSNEEISFANDVFNWIQNDIINKAENLQEEFTSQFNLNKHFQKHCLAKITNRKSTRQFVYYDFKDISQYKNHEQNLINGFLNINSKSTTVASLLDSNEVLKGFHKLFEGNRYLLFSHLCGFKNNGNDIRVGFHSFSTNVTKNYPNSNTIDLIILNSRGKTVSLYPLDANYVENKFNSIVKKYTTLNLPSFNINH